MLTELVENNIKNELQNCELAVENAIRTFSDMLAAMDDEYMRERAVDIRDIGYRLLSILQAGMCMLRSVVPANPTSR